MQPKYPLHTGSCADTASSATCHEGSSIELKISPRVIAASHSVDSAAMPLDAFKARWKNSGKLGHVASACHCRILHDHPVCTMMANSGSANRIGMEILPVLSASVVNLACRPAKAQRTNPHIWPVPRLRRCSLPVGAGRSPLDLLARSMFACICSALAVANGDISIATAPCSSLRFAPTLMTLAALARQLNPLSIIPPRFFAWGKMLEQCSTRVWMIPFSWKRFIIWLKVIPMA